MWLLPVAWATVLAGCVTKTRRMAYVGLSACCVTCALGGAVLTQQALASALRPSLRAVLHEQFGGFAPGSLDEPRGNHPIPARLALTEDAARREDVVTFRARVRAIHIAGGWRPVAGGVAVTVAGTVGEDDRLRWHAGAEVEAPVTFRRPARYLNAGVPDAEAARAVRGVSVVGSVKSGLLVEIRDRGSTLARISGAARQRIRAAVARTVGAHDATSAAVVTAVLIGDDSALPQDLRDRWQAAGTFHVLAISGGNIAVVVALVVAIASVLGRGPRAAAWLALAALAAFACVVTPGSSVQRASLMAALHLGARVLDHRVASWQALAVAVAAMIALDPLGLTDVGLLLTCGATVALIECARVAGRAPFRPGARARRPLRWLLTAVAATACVEAVVFPIQVWWFSRLAFAGIALNLVAVPLMTAAQVLGLLAVALDLSGGPAWPAAWVASHAVSLLDQCMRVSEWVPWLARPTPRPPPILLWAYYTPLVACWYGPARFKWLAGPIAAAAGLAIGLGASTLAAERPSATDLRLTMFDVGQGESLLLEGGRWRALVDAGGRPFGDGLDIGGRVVLPALWARGVTSLDALVITHADPDHVGGAGAVMDAQSVRELWIGVDVPGHEPSQALRVSAEAEGAGVFERRGGEQFAQGPLLIRVLHPPAPDWERRRVRNDDSVVLEIVHGEVAMLLMGDVGADVEREILPRLTPARVRILKVGHHGSRTSTSQRLVDAWRPHMALVSCGRGNTFGHPAPAVLARLRAAGATVFRTDTDGQVTVRSDGRQVWVETFRGRQAWARPLP